ncbi:MAG: competence/damage-inducible protein A [Syntrophomonadaceae bacterium]|nr:competence/damage-inducible protein A [Syntrophomonadaceae bacterium]
MLQAYIIATGDELVRGTTADTNSAFLSARLAELGIPTRGRIAVGDDAAAITHAVAMAAELADLIICTGGLGPTRDDVTRAAVCEAMGCELEVRPEEAQRIRDWFASRGRPMPESNLRQAMFPRDAVLLVNPRGTASGMLFRRRGKIVVLLPGPPRELEPVFIERVEPLLRAEVGEGPGLPPPQVIRVMGPGESQVEEIIQPLVARFPGVQVGMQARDGEIDIRLTAFEGRAAGGQTAVEQLAEAIRAALGMHVIGSADDTLVSVVARELRRGGLTVSCAESCTGGLLAKMLTDLPGSSDYMWGGAVTYSNQAKVSLLGVQPETLAAFGAVSPQTAREMAQGIRERSGADFALSTTGVAGPGGGSPEKPVGLVYVGLADGGSVEAKELRLAGDRGTIRLLAAKCALDWLRRVLQGRGLA